MPLRVALVIDGDQSGAKEALEDTATGIERVDTAAGDAAESLQKVGEEAGTAAAEVDKVGDSAQTSGGKFGSLKSLALDAVGGLVAGFAKAGLEAAIGAASQAFGAFVADIISAGPDIKTALEEHTVLIKAIKGAYAEADGAASSYGNNSVALLTFQAQQNIQRLSDASARGSSDLLTGGLQGDVARSNPAVRLLTGDPNFGTGSAGTPFEEPVERFRQALRDGTADAITFRTEVANIAKELPSGDTPNRSLAEDLIGDAAQLAGVQTELQRAVDLYQALGGNADAAATALGGSADNFTLNGEAAGAALPNLREYDALLSSIGGVSGSVVAPAAAGTGSFTVGGSFATGGFTGHLPTDQVAGLVHGSEYVFDAASTAAIGVGNLDAIRSGIRGYASGGSVGGASGSVGGAIDFRSLGSDLNFLRGAVTGFADALVQTRNPLEALGSVVSSVSQRFLSMALGAVENALFDGPGGGLLGGLFSGLMGGGGAMQQAGIFHQGGVVGGAAPSRMVPASLFHNAPRFHNGLAPREFPAILEEGETVIPRGMRAGGGTVFNITTPNPRAFAQSPSTVARDAARLARSSGRHS